MNWVKKVLLTLFDVNYSEETRCAAKMRERMGYVVPNGNQFKDHGYEERLNVYL